MMKNIVQKILTVAMAIALIAGCSNIDQKVLPPDGLPATDASEQDIDTDTGVPEENDDKLPNEGTVNQGITVNQIQFSIVDPTSLSEEMIKEIDTLKLQRGYTYWPQEDGSYLILISAGEKTTGGYEIEVASMEDNEGKTYISVKESKAEDDMAIQVLTYPYVVVNASGITDHFIIKDQNQEEYKLILSKEA
jgi:hypothetical protein